MKCEKEKHCEALQLAIDSKSVETALVLNMKTGEGRGECGVRVKQGKKKPMLFFNYCPFCRVELSARV